MQNKRVFITVWPQHGRSGAGRMHKDLSSRFVHDGVMDCYMKALKRGHYGAEIGGILFIVEGWAFQGGWKDIVDAIGGSKGHD